MERPSGHLFIGAELDRQTGKRTAESVLIDSADLTTHGVVVGMTGSGKTGLGLVLLEEALLAKIPVLAIDPKGDLGNLALTFPGLSGPEFAPWMDQGKARVDGISVEELAEATATTWRDGLESWGMGPDDVSELDQAASPVIYTPGGSSGIGLNVLGSLTVPPTEDPAARQDEVDSTVSGLLSLIGVKSDPLSGREHILLANLITRAWSQGKDLDLATLLGQILNPPIRKLGVLELDSFYPADDRHALVMKLNGLLASPSFAAWTGGAPLDIGSMLWDSQGRSRAAVVSLNHLAETERSFATTLVLGKLISWMRTQPGTGELRVLVYLDEVAGLAPPIGNPPTKQPILTLLKQARAFGVGLVLATQNPVDIDYKAISNAGTWMIGRLQTEQDKNRLVDGLRSAAGATDIAAVENTISGLDKRQFMLRTTRSADLRLFTSRWAMSYLAGPLTGDQISSLTPRSESDASQPTSQPTTSQPTTSTAPTPATSANQGSPLSLADDESAVEPEVAAELPVRYLSPSAPWGDAVDADPDSSRLVPYLAARVGMLFDETRADLRHRETWEAIVPIGDDGPDLDGSISVDYDDRDLDTEAPPNSVYVLPASSLTKAEVRSLNSDLKTLIHGNQNITLFRNEKLKMWSRPGESAVEFEARCDQAASDAADAEAATIRERLENKRDSIEAALAKAQDRVNELEVQAESRRNSNLIEVGASVLGSLLGGRSKARGLASAARRVSSSRRQSASTGARLDSARNRVGEKIDQLEDLENDLAEALIEIDDEWNQVAADITPVEVGLEKNDITIEDLVVLWIPQAP